MAVEFSWFLLRMFCRKDFAAKILPQRFCRKDFAANVLSCVAAIMIRPKTRGGARIAPRRAVAYNAFCFRKRQRCDATAAVSRELLQGA
jgi:hypothetical protein